ncbi:MAG: GDP-L-fucose synthase [Porticoccus sp.]|nr:GDP-L-fucose synthase [Porticoccus sp.]
MGPVKRVFIAGHSGMVGSSIVRRLEGRDDLELVFRNHKELDLTNQQAVFDFFQHENIDVVYLAAAKVGGIVANNTYPAQFVFENLMIECNVIHSAYLSGVEKLLFLGSSCIYPKLADQPIMEESLMTGSLEATNEPYAVAKIAGIKLCESYNRQYGCDFRSVMPTNLYGPNDNFNIENSHVIPGLIRRYHDAKASGVDKVVVWGTGKPRREFLHVDDMASASVHVMNLDRVVYDEHTNPMLSHVNIGSGVDCEIQTLSELISDVVGFKGHTIFDLNKPDGAPRKLLNVELMESFGWKASISLEKGIESTYRWFLDNQSSFRR